MLTESNILVQARKGQGETNKRLDALLAEQKITNAWLARIAELLEAQQQRPAVQQGQYQPAGVVHHPQQQGRW